MTEQKALSDSELLTLVDDHLLAKANQPMTGVRVMSGAAALDEANASAVGTGQVRRDLPFLRSQPATVKFVACLTSFDSNHSDEFVEVHYETGSGTLVVILKDDKIVARVNDIARAQSL